MILTETEAAIVEAVVTAEPVTYSDLAIQLDLPFNHVYRLVGGLLVRGCLRVAKDSRLWATEAGRASWEETSSAREREASGE